MSEAIKIIGRPPQWMHDPENRAIALAVLESGCLHAEIARQLAEKRNVRASAINLNVFANRNRGTGSAAEFLKNFLTNGTFREINGTEKKPAKPRKKPPVKTNGNGSVPEVPKNFRPQAETTASLASKATLAKKRYTEQFEHALKHYGPKFKDDEAVRDLAKDALFGHASTRIDIKRGDMSVKGKDSTLFLVPGRQIEIDVPISSGHRAKTSEEAKRMYAVALLLKESLESGKFGGRDVAKLLLGLGRVDLYARERGHMHLLTRKIYDLPKYK